MGHHVSLFVGPKAALRPYLEAAPRARMFALTPAAPLFVLPLTDEVHDALHALNGTGEWIEGEAPLRLTNTDMAFAAKAARGTALAYVETDTFGGKGAQSAAAWIDGELVARPTTLATPSGRPHALWPINAALRTIGVKAVGSGVMQDEFSVLGIGLFRSNEAILERGLPVS